MKVGLSESPLQAAREFRCKTWWGVAQIESSRSRELHNLEHANPGAQRTSWAYIFCMVFHVAWRALRDSCARFADWRKLEISFVNRACEIWDLPLLPTKLDKSPAPSPYPLGGELRVCTIQNLPTRVHHPEDLQWDTNGRRISIIVDCLDPEQLFDGHALLSSPELRPICVRIARALTVLYERGWKPRRNIGKFVDWRPRRYNVVADHLCNAAMDGERHEHTVDTGDAAKAWGQNHSLQIY